LIPHRADAAAPAVATETAVSITVPVMRTPRRRRTVVRAVDAMLISSLERVGLPVFAPAAPMDRSGGTSLAESW
jgi:hypothetical protein